jgi:hypothetical protein
MVATSKPELNHRTRPAGAPSGPADVAAELTADEAAR